MKMDGCFLKTSWHMLWPTNFFATRTGAFRPLKYQALRFFAMDKSLRAAGSRSLCPPRLFEGLSSLK
jgi:hypothetical protein